MKIYLDLLIIQDTIITSMILFLLSRLLKIKISLVKIFVVALISSILSTCILVFAPKLYDNFFIKLVLSYFIVMFLNSKRERNSKVFLFWIITFLFGGIGFASEKNLFLMILLMLLSIFFILKFKKRQNTKLLLETSTCFIEFEFNNKLYKLKALLDTGHDVTTLYDEDIIFVKEDLFNYEGGDNKHRRVVSYQTVSGKQKEIGIKVFNITVNYNNKKICNNAVIVRTPNILNSYDAIIGYRLIEGGWTNGDFNFNEAESKKTFY